MRPLALLFLVSIGLQLGCETRVSLGNACRSDSECSGGLRCNFGRCRAGCTDSAQCGAGEHCLTINGTQGACTLPTDTCNPEALRYCEDGLTCVNQACVSLCGPTRNACLPGTMCNMAASACLPMSITLPDAGMDAGTAGTDANLDASMGADAFCEAPRPTTVPPSTLCVGKHYGCAIVSGQVQCWGSSRGGQLGNGIDDHTPAPYPNCTSGEPCTDVPTVVMRGDATPLSNVVSIGCGDGVCALTDTGEVWCWGYVAETAVALARRYATGATSIAVGFRHVCAQIGGGYACWGTNTSNLVDYPEAEYRLDRRLGHSVTLASSPIAADDFAGSERVAAGAYFTCAARCGGVYCQGWSEGTVCGNDPVFQSDGVHGVRIVVPHGNRILDGHPDDIHAGYVHACVLSDGVVSCFGGHQNGALGNRMDVTLCNTLSVYECRPTPRPIDISAFPTLRFTSLSHGIASTSCAIAEGTGEVYCWGQSELGQAGGMEAWATTVHGPVEADGGPLRNVTEVAVGDTSSCARRADGAVYCWGGNAWGELARPSDDIAHTSAFQVTFP